VPHQVCRFQESWLWSVNTVYNPTHGYTLFLLAHPLQLSLSRLSLSLFERWLKSVISCNPIPVSTYINQIRVCLPVIIPIIVTGRSPLRLILATEQRYLSDYQVNPHRDNVIIDGCPLMEQCSSVDKFAKSVNGPRRVPSFTRLTRQ